jgi:lysophospholipase L1-like esterase
LATLLTMARHRALLTFAAAIVVAACASATPTLAPSNIPSPTISPTVAAPTADLEHPVGIVAIGHSALTGEGTAGTYTGSWATGTLPSVNSLYLRMIEALPATEGHVSNKAVGGASASALVRQAQAALAEVPAPALVIIDTIDNDIQCDASNVEQVTNWIADALASIHEASPNSQILVVDQPGRPSIDFVKSVVEKFPATKATVFTWSDDCSFYDAEGNLDEAAFAKLTAAIDQYENAQFQACALVPNCHDDGGVRRAYVDTIENFSPDFAHFNARGQAAQAELLWPVVKGILGL